MSRDRTVGETFYMFFTTRAFATGIPTVLAGSPVVSAYEDDSATQITAGITLGVSHDSVVGLNLLTVVATGANGYEAGKDYSFVITTGTVGGVSVVGEVVGEFSLGLSAAFTRLGAPAGASVSADIADVPTVAEFNARTLVAASYFDPAADTVAAVTLVTTVTTLTGHTAQTADHTAAIADIPTTAEFEARTLVAASYFDPAADTVADVTLTATTTAVTNQVTADMTALSGSSGAADLLQAIMDGALLAQVNDASATTTDFAADGFTEATDDHFNGRLITFVTGALVRQQTDITDYDAAGGAQGSQQFTVTALTEAPADGDFFVVH